MTTWLRLSPGRLRRRAVLRDLAEGERASSPPELFFDLTFVDGVRVAGRPGRRPTAPVGAAVAGCAAVMTAIAPSMVLVSPEPAENGGPVAVGTGSYVAQDA